MGATLIDVPAGKIAAVVTSLEMTARPAPRPERAGDDFALDLVTNPDLGWYRALFRRVGAEWLWFSRLRMDDGSLAAILRHKQVEVHVLRAAGAESGLLELDFREAPDCHLAFCGVVPGRIGQGAGRFLMNRAIDRAWSRPISRFLVHTCTLDHPAALDFYIRSGFRPVRRQVEIADDPRLDGTLPADAAPGVPML